MRDTTCFRQHIEASQLQSILSWRAVELGDERAFSLHNKFKRERNRTTNEQPDKRIPLAIYGSHFNSETFSVFTKVYRQSGSALETDESTVIVLCRHL